MYTIDFLEKVLQTFNQMQKSVTFANNILACATMEALEDGKDIDEGYFKMDFHRILWLGFH